VSLLSKIRKPAVAGLFYEGSKDRLIKQIEWAFQHDLGPRMLPKGEPGRERSIIAAQVPHAGYVYSGPAAAHVYYALYYDGKPDTFIIIGPNHHGIGAPVAIYDGDAWETPLGTIPIDKELVDLLSKHDVFELDDRAHEQEHSLEVQVPMLQYVFGNNFQIVPIALADQSLFTIKKIAEAIVDAWDVSGRDIVVLASSDMSHYEPHEVTMEKDKEAIMAIEALDADALYRIIFEKNVTMCGFGAVAVAITLARMLGAKPFTLTYYTSGDISGDKSAVVGYASIIFSRVPREGGKEVGYEAEALPL